MSINIRKLSNDHYKFYYESKEITSFDDERARIVRLLDDAIDSLMSSVNKLTYMADNMAVLECGNDL